MLGPMVNPSKPKKQLVGVFSLELARLYGYLYQQTESRFGIVHSIDGYDEVSLTGPFKMIQRTGESICQPNDIGFDRLKQEDLAGGNTVESSARLFKEILEEKGTTAQQNAVLANSGLALSVARECSIEEGVESARESLNSGKALSAFKKFIEVNKA